MILKLHNNNIIVKQNEYPEDLYETPVSYEYELGTNNFKPVLYINSTAYVGSDLKIPFNSYDGSLQLRVELYDGNNTRVRTYTGNCMIYKMCTLGTASHINVYKENTRLRKRIKELEEKGDIV